MKDMPCWFCKGHPEHKEQNEAIGNTQRAAIDAQTESRRVSLQLDEALALLRESRRYSGAEWAHKTDVFLSKIGKPVCGHPAEKPWECAHCGSRRMSSVLHEGMAHCMDCCNNTKI